MAPAQRLPAALGLLLLAVAAAAQGAGFSLRVEADCAADGELYLIVVDEKGQDDRLSGTANAILRAEKGRRTVHVFEGLASGVYGVKAFIDLNRNAELDAGAFGFPSEPWGMSWRTKKPALRPPRFTDYSFRLDADRTVRFSVE